MASVIIFFSLATVSSASTSLVYSVTSFFWASIITIFAADSFFTAFAFLLRGGLALEWLQLKYAVVWFNKLVARFAWSSVSPLSWTFITDLWRATSLVGKEASCIICALLLDVTRQHSLQIPVLNHCIGFGLFHQGWTLVAHEFQTIFCNIIIQWWLLFAWVAEVAMLRHTFLTYVLHT